MPRKSHIGLAGLLVLGSASSVLADHDGSKNRRHVGEARIERSLGRLVRHPAWSFACQSPYYYVGGMRCDQPIWVYGSPCEVDLGRGRWKPCD